MNILDLRLIDNERVSSLQLLKLINNLRSEEYELKEELGTLTDTEIKRGKYVEITHDRFIKVIKDEFEEDIIEEGGIVFKNDTLYKRTK